MSPPLQSKKHTPLGVLGPTPVVSVGLLNGKLWLREFVGHLLGVYIPSAQITDMWRLVLIIWLMRLHGKCQNGHVSLHGLPAWRWGAREGRELSTLEVLF